MWLHLQEDKIIKLQHLTCQCKRFNSYLKGTVKEKRRGGRERKRKKERRREGEGGILIYSGANYE